MGAAGRSGHQRTVRGTEAYGEEKAKAILNINIHHMLVYPCNCSAAVAAASHIRPLAHDKTLTEI